MFHSLLDDELATRQQDFHEWVDRYLVAKAAVELVKQRAGEPKTSLARFLNSRRDPVDSSVG